MKIKVVKKATIKTASDIICPWFIDTPLPPPEGKNS
jgi:hypothetical protein